MSGSKHTVGWRCHNKWDFCRKYSASSVSTGVCSRDFLACTAGEGCEIDYIPGHSGIRVGDAEIHSPPYFGWERPKSTRRTMSISGPPAPSTLRRRQSSFDSLPTARQIWNGEVSTRMASQSRLQN
jgi:hypothetical protein